MTATPKPEIPGTSFVPVLALEEKTTGMSGQVETETQVTAIDPERGEVDRVALESLKDATAELRERLDTAMIDWKSTQDALAEFNKSSLAEQHLQYVVLLDKYDAAVQELVRVVVEEQTRANGDLQARLSLLRVRLLESASDEVRRRRQEVGDPTLTIVAFFFFGFVCYFFFFLGAKAQARRY